MRFRILSIKDNSVRVNSGIVTFDVQIVTIDDKLKLSIPDNIFISDTRDFKALAGAVLGEYNNSIGANNSDKKQGNSSS